MVVGTVVGGERDDRIGQSVLPPLVANTVWFRNGEAFRTTFTLTDARVAVKKT
jgi:hypothetical protein